MQSDSRKTLIVGPSWVGDMVMAQSLCIDLKNQNPNIEIDMLAPQWTAALIERMPQVDKLIATHFQHGKLSLGARWQLGKALRRETYTDAIVLPNSLKAAMVPAIARIPLRTGFLGEQRWGLLTDIRPLDKQQLPMTVQRFLALGRKQGADNVAPDDIPSPALKVEAGHAIEVAAQFKLSTNKPILSLCPGAEFGPSKQWPANRYGEAASYFMKQGWQVWLFGSEKDKADCDQINRQLEGNATVLAGRTSLPQAIDLLSLSQLVLSNDSGLMHIAAGLRKPLVAVYGSTDPAHTPPLNKNHRIAQQEISCSPCFARHCPLSHHNCMEQLSVALVTKLAEDVLR